MPRSAALLLFISSLVLGGLTAATAQTPRQLQLAPGVTGTGLVDLANSTYANAKTALNASGDLKIPINVPDLDLVTVNDIDVYSNDATNTVAVQGTGTVLGHASELLLTAVWDNPSLKPKLALGFKFASVSLGSLNSSWDQDYANISLSNAWLAVGTSDHLLTPANLPTAVQDFYNAEVAISAGVNFAGDIDLSVAPGVQNLLSYAGHDNSTLSVKGKFAVSAAALKGSATAEQKAGLNLKATMTSDGGAARPWLTGRVSVFELKKGPEGSSISIADEWTVEMDGTENTFKGSVAFTPGSMGDGSKITVDLAAEGDFVGPFGLDALTISDVGLELKHTFGGSSSAAIEASLAIADGPNVTLKAAIETDGAEVSLDLSLEGSISAGDVVGLAGDLMSVDGLSAGDLGDLLTLTGVHFSFATGSSTEFALEAEATLNGVDVSVLASIKKATGEPAKMLFGLAGAGDVSLEDLISTEIEGFDLTVVDPVIVFAQGWGSDPIPTSELNNAEEQFLLPFYGEGNPSELPDTLDFESGLNFQGGVKLDGLGNGVKDALGYDAGEVVTLTGHVGIELSGLSGGASGGFTGFSLAATLPALAPPSFPDWLTLQSGWTLELSFDSATSKVTVAAGGGFDVDLGENGTFDGDLAVSFSFGGGGVAVEFEGSIGEWANPFGLTWLTLDEVMLKAKYATGKFEVAFKASVEIEDNNVTVELVVGNDGGFNVDVKLSTDATISLFDVATFLGVSDLTSLPSQLHDLTIGPLSIHAHVGAPGPSLSLLANTTIPAFAGGSPLGGQIMVEFGAGNFIVGLRATNDISLDDFVSSPPINPTVEDGAIVITKAAVTKQSDTLSDQAFGFFKEMFGCEADDDREECDFNLKLASGLELRGRITLPDSVDKVVDGLWMDAEQGVLLRGQIPIFGGNVFSLTVDLPKITPPASEYPDWFHSGQLSLSISNTGVELKGDLGVRFRNSSTPCPGQVLNIIPSDPSKGTKCYDVLTFRLAASIGFTPPSVKLTGSLIAEDPWEKAFGLEWLTLNELTLQLGLEVAPTPTFTLGFLGDVVIGDKDIRASVSLAFRTVPGPPGIVPELRGLTARSKAGVEMQDLVELGEAVSGQDLSTDGLPNIAVRNLDFMYGAELNTALCIRPGLMIAGDVYINPGPAPTDNQSGDCRTIPTEDPDKSQQCKNDASCFASVRFEMLETGIKADGFLQAFELGPIDFDGAEVRLRLTAAEQAFFLKGGVSIGEFGSGKIQVDLKPTAISFAGDVKLFGGGFNAYVAGNGAFNFSSPNFQVRVVLRADFNQIVAGAIDGSARSLKKVILALDEVWDVVKTGDPLVAFGKLTQKLGELGQAPADVQKVLNKINEITQEIAKWVPGTTFVLDKVLNGINLGRFPGVPSAFVPESDTCVFTWSGNRCWTTPPSCWSTLFGDVCWPGTPGVVVPRTCIGEGVVDGKCWLVKPFDIPSIPGICSAIVPPAVAAGGCTTEEFMEHVVEPALVNAFKSITGLNPNAATFTDLLDQLVSKINQAPTLALECAEFEGALGQLAGGGAGASVGLAARVNLFGFKAGFGVNWNFKAEPGASVFKTIEGIFNSLLNIGTRECIGLPEEAPSDAAASGVSLSLNKANVVEGGSITASGAVLGNFSGEKTIKIEWGDGSSDTVTTNGKAYSKTHTYADDDPTGAADTTYVVTATVQDNSGAKLQKSLAVTNHAPDLTLTVNNASINEAGSVTASGSINDFGTLDTESLKINWGDGSPEETVPLTGGTGSYSFSKSHTYADDNPTATQSDDYTITATVTDDDTGTTAKTAIVKVNDVAPSAVTLTPTARLLPDGDDADTEADRAVLAPNAPIEEGWAVEYSGTFTDPGTLDAHTMTVDWKDGSTSVFSIPVGQRTFVVSHLFEDDNPTGTSSDTKNLEVVVADDDGKSGSATRTVTIANVAPHTVELTSSDSAGVLQENQKASIIGSFVDPGLGDDHDVVIDWGDGSVDTRLELVRGARTFAADHIYIDDNPTNTASDEYTVTVTLDDDDRGSVSSTSDITVENVEPTFTTIDVTDALEDEAGSLTVTYDEKNTVSFEADFDDPGTRDTYDVLIDWGQGWSHADRFESQELAVGDRSFEASKEFGDNGIYTVDVLLTDDDTEVDSFSFTVDMTNVDPTLVFDGSGLTSVYGVPTFLGHEGDTYGFSASAEDPGSDDVTFHWDFDDGGTLDNTHLVHDPNEDDFPSPQVAPRDETDPVDHEWANACLYFMTLQTTDDDLGSSQTDTVPIVMAGNTAERWSLGAWHHQYKVRTNEKNVLPWPRRKCFLNIVEHMSAVFDEMHSIDTAAEVEPLLDGPGSTEKAKLQRALLRAWLDFSNGAFDYDEPVDVDGDGIADSTFSEAMVAAENAYRSPFPISSQLKTHRQDLNEMVGLSAP